MRRPDLVEVHTTTKGRDEAGASVEVLLEVVEVPCRIEPYQAGLEAAAGAGVTDRELLHLYADSWPMGTHSKVLWEGRRFKQVGPAKRYRYGQRTRHVLVTLEAVDKQ